jgi:molecular chaperone GrpE
MSDHKKDEQSKHNPDKEKIKELEAKVATNLAGWKKALADYQNLQKETDKRLAVLSDFMLNGFILELLPIFDNYRTALAHIPAEQKKESWATGLEHILKMWESFLQYNKVEKIKTIDEKFDPHWHESVGQISDDKQKDHLIVEEKQSGYKINGSIIRPAKVIINNLPQKIEVNNKE